MKTTIKKSGVVNMGSMNVKAGTIVNGDANIDVNKSKPVKKKIDKLSLISTIAGVLSLLKFW